MPQPPAPPGAELARPTRPEASGPLAPTTAIPLRWLALAYRIATAALIVWGVVRISQLFTPEPVPSSFAFYTVQSNLLCLVWVVLLIVRTIGDLRRHGPIGVSTPSPRWGGAVMMAITVTLLIYLIVLVPTVFAQPGDYVPFSLTDNLIHIITPVLLIADWLLFSPKGHFRWIDPLLWALIPIAYLVYAYVYGGLGGEFFPGEHVPYPFMDVAAIGLPAVAAWLLGLTVSLVAVGYLYVAIDRALGRLGTRR